MAAKEKGHEVAYVDTLDHSSIAGQPVPGAQQEQEALNSQCWPMGTASNALEVLVQVGYVGSATGFDVGAAFLLLEVIPLAPLVSARTQPSRSPASSRALRSAICSRYRATSSGARLAVETQPLGQLSAEPLAFF